MSSPEELTELEKNTSFLWGAKAIAARLGISVSQFYHMTNRNQLKGVSRVGSQYVATIASLQRIVETDDRGETPPEPPKSAA